MINHFSFVVNGINIAPVMTDFVVNHEISYEQVITTQDGKEHCFGMRDRPILSFGLHLMKSGHDSALFSILKSVPLTVEYTDPDLGDVKKPFRLSGSIEKELKCWNDVEVGNYFSSGTIVLRCMEVV